MKKFLLITIILPLLFSCSKKKGCNYSKAVNYDEMAVIDDGSCTFTKLTFYASNNYFFGQAVSLIEVEVKGTTNLGSFSGIQQAGGACGGVNIVTYDSDDEPEVSWVATIHLAADSTHAANTIYNSGTAYTSPTLPCLEINTLP